MAGVINHILDHCRISSGGDYSFSENCYRYYGFSVPENGLNPRDPQGVIVKDSRSTTAAVQGELFLKNYNARGWLHRLKRRFQTPRPHRCLAAALCLRQAGIATPRVLMATAAQLVTECLPPEAIMLDSAPGIPGPEIAGFLAGLHRAGIYHGDVNLRNLYRTTAGFGVIDLDGARIFATEVPDYWRRRELARLISGWLRCVGRLGWTVAAPERVCEEFVRAYQLGGGPDLSGTRLQRRVNYLTGRIRRRK